MSIPYPPIRPDLFRIGPFSVRWYAVMYVVGYIVGAKIAARRAARGLVRLSPADIDAFISYMMISMLLGARLMYAAVYEPGHYFSRPLEFFAIWHGGLSFHGAVIGMVIATALFARRRAIPF